MLFAKIQLTSTLTRRSPADGGAAAPVSAAASPEEAPVSPGARRHEVDGERVADEDEPRVHGAAHVHLSLRVQS
jgi:hypothetical protein